MVDITAAINKALEVAPSLRPINTKLLLTDRYETTFGICNHDATMEDRPLLLVAMQPAEDTCHGSVLYERLEQFADYQVPKYFGMSLNEFLELPTDVCSRILSIAGKKQKVEGTIASNALDQLNIGK